WCMDMSRKNVPAFDYVSWPPRGIMPTKYFQAQQAWSVSLAPRKYRKPAARSVKVELHSLDKVGKKVGDALELDYKNVNLDGFGIPNCIIFRPAKLSVADGKKHQVTISGIETAAGKPATITYAVEFVQLAKK